MKNYIKLLTELEKEVCAELIELLGKTGDISIDDDKWEFFNLATVCEQEIDHIDSKGRISGGFQNGVLISELVDSSTLSVLDIITLVNELRIELNIEA